MALLATDKGMLTVTLYSLLIIHIVSSLEDNHIIQQKLLHCLYKSITLDSLSQFTFLQPEEDLTKIPLEFG